MLLQNNVDMEPMAETAICEPSSSRRDLQNLNCENICRKWMDILYSRRGLFFALLVAFCWCGSDVCTKVLSKSLHPMEIACLRQCILGVMSTPLVVHRSAIAVDSHGYWKLLFLRGLSGALNTLCRTLACSFMSIANVSAVANTAPVFAALLGWAVLRERIQLTEGFMSLLAITGVVLIAQPPFLFNFTSSSGEDNFVGVIFALGDAFTTAFSIVVLRKLGNKSVNILTPIAYYAVIGIVIDAALTTAMRSWTWPPCLPERLLLIAFGPLMLFAQLSLAEASRLEKALNVSLVTMLTICLSLVLQLLIFKTLPNWLSAVGTVLVLMSAVTLLMVRSKDQRGAVEGDQEGSTSDQGIL